MSGRTALGPDRAVVAAILVVAGFKLYLAASLGLFQDEAFYWMQSQRLAA